MFSRILTKLIDEAILPAVLLLATKVASTVLLVRYYNIPLAEGTNYFTVYFSNQADFIKVNSYSTMAMAVVIFLGSLAFLFKSRLLHDTHISPANATKVAGLGLNGFIKTSLDVYSEGSIWLSYSLLLSLLLGIQVYYQIVYPITFAVSMSCSIFLTLILLSDVEREVTRKYA
jgi:hypothetical protein